MNKTPSFVVCDLETTGLNCRTDCILEAGLAVTDSELNIIDQKSWLVLDMGWSSRLKSAPDAVRSMHQDSGLVRDLERANETSLSAMRCGITNVANEMYTWLFNHNVQGNLPATGSTIGFDRKFLQEHMPQVDACFSYRSIDISSIKELCKIWNPRVYAAFEKLTAGFKKEHRVLPDIQASLDELEFYMNEFLLVDFDTIAEGQEPLPL